MGPRRIAPPAVIGRQRKVGRAKVGRRYENGRTASVAPLRVVGALDLEAGPTAEPVVEQRRAQRRRRDAVPLAVQVPVPARPP